VGSQVARFPVFQGAALLVVGCSVGRPQDLPDLRVLQPVLPQPVVMAGAHPGESSIVERQMGVRIQTRRDLQCIPRQITLEHVIAVDVEAMIGGRGHVEAPVAQRVEDPVSTRVILHHSLGDAVDDLFQFQREVNAEKPLHDDHAAVHGNERSGDS
jgi:hypothetical protein